MPGDAHGAFGQRQPLLVAEGLVHGIEEKLLAAHRGKIREVLIPRENEKDLKEIPKKILKELHIVLVDHMDDVLKHALRVDDPKKLFRRGKEGKGLSDSQTLAQGAAAN